MRPLTDKEKARYRRWFEDALLDSVRLSTDPPGWLPGSFMGITLHEVIYFRSYDPDSLEDAVALGHELVHARQYRAGMTIGGYLWSCREGYDGSPYEDEAYGLEPEMREVLKGEYPWA
jgi:hypothetical protein